MTWTENDSGDMDSCGEACIPYGKFWEYSEFEKHLQKSTKGGDEDMCGEYMFPHYVKTETHVHGAGLFNMKFDFYDKGQ